ncbi:chromosomal replication initiator protein DnaA [Puniceicoccales bacterium CK1056]|uniref:Chromosomal replication initiator protein DnaA n=1 Tax=Oceanipulchritudo coccoides TaxID=2706888 RepID=A0A6B2M4G9_9BACT|nr:chromosomal replication initiator protein DnaA [Oceanipulchritudo coccoides]NDV63246.1 chromosomal replication initiator protein DnaA [Oceanipulchritudo coccoides]
MPHSSVTESLWTEVLQDFRNSLSQDIYANWFQSIDAILDESGTLELRAANEFARIWLEDNYLELIREKAAAIAGEEVMVRITAQDSGSVQVAPREPVDVDSDRGRGGKFGRTGQRTLHPARNPYLNPRNTFDNFIVGPSNQLAHAAATAVADSPGSAYNPLFVYGDTGLGKTHLMHAMAHAIQQSNPEAKVVYLSCEKFTNNFLRAIRENSLDSFRRFYRKVDVLLIDDIQFLEGKERTQEEFFHTFNELFESQRQLCLSSDRPASEINKLESRLISRFQWGMVTDIQPPDLETRAAILKKKAMAMGFDLIPEEVLEFLASRITRNVRRLEGALIKVGTFARLIREPLTRRKAEELIHDILQEEVQHQITIERIQRKVVEMYDLRLSDMQNRRRPSHIAFPRQVAMYLSRLLTHHPLKEIGESFGGRDHGTVIHAVKTVENMMEQDEKVRNSVEYLVRQLRGNRQ